MNGKGITRISLTEARGRKGRTDWDRLRREEAAGVEPAADAVGDGFDWMKAVVVQAPGKETMTIRLDKDVLDWFRASGKGYQTRINAILRAWVDAQDKNAR